MRRNSFPPPQTAQSRRDGDIVSAAKATMQREVWATQAVMLMTGLSKDQTFMLGAKALGRYFSDLWELSPKELREVREYITREGRNDRN